MKKLLFIFLIPVSVCLARESDESLRRQGYESARYGKDLYRKQSGGLLFRKSPEFGFLNNANVVVRDEMRDFDHVVFSADYRLDQYGRRDTGGVQKSRAFIALLGCSFAFGTGLSDRQTLSYDLSEGLKTHTYNYAIPGGALNQILYRFKTENIREQIPETRGIFVYLPIESHVARVNGSSPSVTWMNETPHFKKAGDHMQYDGTIESVHPWLTAFYKFVGGWLERGDPGRQFPKTFQSDYEYFCDLTEDLSKEVKKQFPTSEFVIVNHPIIPLEPPALKCLKERQLHVVSLSIPGERLPRLGDGHPSAMANKNISAEMTGFLSIMLKSP